jgi:hypothetical protein
VVNLSDAEEDKLMHDLFAVGPRLAERSPTERAMFQKLRDAVERTN